MQLEMSARNAMANAFGALFATGSQFRLRTGANANVAVIGLGDTPFAAAADGVIAANTTTPDASAVGGLIAHAALFNAADALQARLTVGTLTGEIILTTLTIPPGATVSLASLTFTMPGS